MKAKKQKEAENHENYPLCWEYIKESRVYFLIISLLFLFSAFIGFIYPVFFLELIKKFIQELVEKTSGMNFFQLLVFILKNNITTAFLGLLLGLIIGIFPLFITFFNGYILGFISTKTANVLGYSTLLRLLPHGIFEIPALILSLGLGLKLGMFIFNKKPKQALIYNLENSLRVFLYVVIPLLLIAGLIETLAIFLLK